MKAFSGWKVVGPEGTPIEGIKVAAEDNPGGLISAYNQYLQEGVIQTCLAGATPQEGGIQEGSRRVQTNLPH